MSDHIDELPPRIPNAASAELRVNDRLLYVLQQRREDELDEVEAAALVESLRSLADSLEASTLDQPAARVLEEAEALVTVDDDTPSNVPD